MAPPPPPEPRHPGLPALREMLARYMGAPKAEAAIAEAAREGHEHLRNHRAHPLYKRTVTEAQERAVYDQARGAFEAALLRRYGGGGKAAR